MVGDRHGRASVTQKLAGGQGVPLPDRPSGLTPGVPAGSQSPGGPRQTRPGSARCQSPGGLRLTRPRSARCQSPGGPRQTRPGSSKCQSPGGPRQTRPGSACDCADSAPDLQGLPLPDRTSGPTPGASAGSQSPGKPRADKPRVGWARNGRQGPHPGRRPAVKLESSGGPRADKLRVGWETGRASAPEVAGRQGMPHPDRSPGPKPGAAAGSQSSSGPRVAKPRVGWGSRPSEPAGKVCPAWTDRQGPRPGAEAKLRPPSAARHPATGIGRGYRPGLAHVLTRAAVKTTPKAGTDAAPEPPTRAALKGLSTDRLCPAAAGPGKGWVAVH